MCGSKLHTFLLTVGLGRFSLRSPSFPSGEQQPTRNAEVHDQSFQRSKIRQRLSSSSRVMGRKLPSRRPRRSCEIARSCSGMAKPSSLRPPSEDGIARWRTLPKSVRVSGTASERPRLVWFNCSTETITKGRDLASPWLVSGQDRSSTRRPSGASALPLWGRRLETRLDLFGLGSIGGESLGVSGNTPSFRNTLKTMYALSCPVGRACPRNRILPCADG